MTLTLELLEAGKAKGWVDYGSISNKKTATQKQMYTGTKYQCALDGDSTNPCNWHWRKGLVHFIWLHAGDHNNLDYFCPIHWVQTVFSSAGDGEMSRFDVEEGIAP